MKWMRALLAALLIVIVAAPYAAADENQIIFVVRHAERAASGDQAAETHRMMADDPPLTPAGQARAGRLAAMLAPAGIARIYTTEYQRTRQTAAPLAQKLKLTPVMAAANDPAPLIAQLIKGKGNALVVGHANTIPDLLKKLGVKDPVTIADNDYDDLFVVVRRVGEPSTLIRLKY
jgi:broad specificity phosphatase PhoE